MEEQTRMSVLPDDIIFFLLPMTRKSWLFIFLKTTPPNPQHGQNKPPQVSPKHQFLVGRTFLSDHCPQMGTSVLPIGHTPRAG